MPLGAHRHGAVPAPVSRAGCSRQFGRASAPMMPHRVHNEHTTISGRAADDPRQHARQRRAVARGVVLAVPSSPCAGRTMALEWFGPTIGAQGKKRTMAIPPWCW